VKTILNISDCDLEGKTVLVRLDLNVPMKTDESGNKVITDDTRIRAAIPAIKEVIESGGRPIVCSHLGRPKGKRVKDFSLEPVANHLSNLMETEVTLMDDVVGEGVKHFARQKSDWKILMLENLRFHSGETSNDPQFTSQLASIAESYVTDAFGTLHRKHASTYGVPSRMDIKAAGPLVEKEIQQLDILLKSAERPFTVILGGAKVSDKILTIEKLIEISNTFIIGGAMANSFLRAKGLSCGTGPAAEDDIKEAQRLLRVLEQNKRRVLLPEDVKIAAELNATSFSTVSAKEIPEDQMALDLGEKTIKSFKNVIQESKTVFWNGPLGYIENSIFQEGTFEVSHCLSESSAHSVIGGGDTALAVKLAGDTENMTHVCTGGGATLEYLANGSLPGVEALKKI
jgi:3-phosphoglycerate kinase